MMPSIIYIHGFASSGQGPKLDALVGAFGSRYKVLAPDLPVNPAEVEKIIDELVLSTGTVLFVGTSLGGFWANYFAQKYSVPCVLVNPLVDPARSLLKYVGHPVKNFKLGTETNVTVADITQFAKLEGFVQSKLNLSLVHLLVAKDDPLIPCENPLKFFKGCASVEETPDGGHRFIKHIPKIIEVTSRLL